MNRKVLYVCVTIWLSDALSVWGQTHYLGKCPYPPTQENFKTIEFLGRWFEIERTFALFEANQRCVTAEYFLREDGKIGIRNSGVNSVGRETSIGGHAIVPDHHQPAELVVFLNGVPFAANLKVLHTDYYNFAVLWSCTSIFGGILGHTENMWILSRKPYLDEGLKNVLYQFLVQTGVGLKGLKGVDQIHCPHREVKIPTDPADGYIDYIPESGYGLKKNHAYGPLAKEERPPIKNIGPGPFKPPPPPPPPVPSGPNVHFEEGPIRGYSGRPKDFGPIPVDERTPGYRDTPGATYAHESKDTEQIRTNDDNREEPDDADDPRMAFSDEYRKPGSSRVRFSNGKDSLRDPDPRERYVHDNEDKIRLGERPGSRDRSTREKKKPLSRYEQFKATFDINKRLDSAASNQTITKVIPKGGDLATPEVAKKTNPSNVGKVKFPSETVDTTTVKSSTSDKSSTPKPKTESKSSETSVKDKIR